MPTPSQPDSTGQLTGQLHILLIRHGETQDNIDRVLQGHHDTHLTPKGHREAQVIAELLRDRHIDALYHSPLTRMVQTVQPLLGSHPELCSVQPLVENHPELRSDSNVHGDPELQTDSNVHSDPKLQSESNIYSDPDLRGQCLGTLEGKSYDTIDMSNPRSADDRPGVENFDDFVRRLKGSFARILGVEAPKTVLGKDRVVVVATHGMAITALFQTLENRSACQGFNPRIAVRGPNAYEVRWTDSDDVARLIVSEPRGLPVRDGVLDWDSIDDKPFVVEYWGKKKNSLGQGYVYPSEEEGER